MRMRFLLVFLNPAMCFSSSGSSFFVKLLIWIAISKDTLQSYLRPPPFLLFIRLRVNYDRLVALSSLHSCLPRRDLRDRRPMHIYIYAKVPKKCFFNDNRIDKMKLRPCAFSEEIVARIRHDGGGGGE
jgi:hypothetical protein